MARADCRLRTGLVAVVLAVLAACGGGGGPSAEEVAVRWRQALEKGDYDTTWDLEGPNLRGTAGKAAAIAYRRDTRFGQPLSPGAAAVSIKAVRTGDDPDHPSDVRVYLLLQTKDPDRNHQEAVGLRKIGGAWRVQRSEPFVPASGLR